MLYKREVKEAQMRLNSDILVTHRYVGVTRDSEGDRIVKSVTDEFQV